MDDFIILLGDKKQLHEMKNNISKFLKGRLRLKFNPKSDIFPAGRGIDFLGYRIWGTHRLLRKSSLIRASRRFKWMSKAYNKGIISFQFIKSSVMAWLGHCSHANAVKGKEICMRGLVLSKSKKIWYSQNNFGGQLSHFWRVSYRVRLYGNFYFWFAVPKLKLI